MLSTAAPLALVLLAASPAYAQFGFNNGYNNGGSSYGTRIGIGVGVAIGVAMIILGIGFCMRKRRAKAFRQAYPAQPNTSNAYNGGPYGQGGGVPLQQHQPSYEQQPAFQEAPPYSNYRQDASGYTPNNYAPQGESSPYYPPPSSPPPAQGNSHSYAPPPGPPPATYDPTNVQNK